MQWRWKAGCTCWYSRFLSDVLLLGFEHQVFKYALVLVVHCGEERMRKCNPQNARCIFPLQRNGDVRRSGIYKAVVHSATELYEGSPQMFATATEQAELLQYWGRPCSVLYRTVCILL